MNEKLEEEILDLLYSELKEAVPCESLSVVDARKICAVIAKHIEQLSTFSSNYRYEFYRGARDGVNKLFNILKIHKHYTIDDRPVRVVDWDDIEQEKTYCIEVLNQLEDLRKKC